MEEITNKEKEIKERYKNKKRQKGSSRNFQDRQTSYVKKFLLCKRCGVKIPKKGSVAGGKVKCPYCGQYMMEAY